MKNLLGIAPFCDSVGLMAVLEKTYPMVQGFEADSGAPASDAIHLFSWVDNPDKASDIEVALAQPLKLSAVLVYCDLTHSLARAAAQGVLPSEAIAQWKSFASRAIFLLKRYRGRVQLFEYTQLLSASAAFTDKTGWQLDLLPPMSSALTPPVVFNAVALQCVSTDSVLRQLSTQLQALQTPLTEVLDTDFIDLDAWVAEWQQLQLKASELPDQQAENTLLIEQLHLVQESLEQALLKEHEFMQQVDSLEEQSRQTHSAKQTLEQRLVETEQRLAHAEQALKQSVTSKEAADVQMAELQTENTLLIEQLHLVQEALEQKYLEHQTVQQTVHQQDVEIHTLQQQMIQLKETHQAWIDEHLVFSLPLKNTLKEHKRKRTELKLAKIIESSDLFDAKWYLTTYPDIAEHPGFKKRPALHYLKLGGFEGRNPSLHFDSLGYLETNSDVANDGLNPLLHFILHGREEGRDPRP